MCLASGRPVLCYRFPGSESYFQDVRDVVLVSSIDDIVYYVNYFKNNPEKANEIGKNGYLKGFSEHSFTSRILELYSITGVRL
jgi:spore maturation protein CgeB